MAVNGSELDATWLTKRMLSFSLPAGAPTNCSSVPTAPLTDGSWPSSCAGAAFGATCAADCTYGGTVTVTCQTSGAWDSTASGSCGGGCSSHTHCGTVEQVKDRQ